MNNQIITQKQAQEIFTKICIKNQWHILLSQYGDNDKEYYLRSSKMSEDDVKRYSKSKILTPQEFAKDINFMEASQIKNFRITQNDKFGIVAGFLKESNLNTVKKLKFFSNNRDKGFKNWESVLSLLNHTDHELPLDGISTILSKYHSKISVKNYSTASGDLPDLFKLLNKCKVQNSNYNFHPALFAFCANHLDQILENTTVKTFIFNKLKNIVPDKIAYYKEFLQIQGADKDFFLETTPRYRTFHLNKDCIFKDYLLNMQSPANSDNYFTILESATVFLNKNKILEKLNCNHIELFGKQQKHDNFIFAVDTKEDFKEDLLKIFFTALMNEAVALSNNLTDCNSSNLKYALKNKYEIIFNHAKLEMELPDKKELICKSSKL